jgi:HAE1 family hydrophobic/amphiphilic exporter-1
MSKFFINRPIVAMVIAILMVLVGVISMLRLPISQFPSIVPPEILVSAIYPGANAQTLEQSVATPLEEQISGVDNMNYMYSINANNGQTQITVDFDVSTDPNIDQVLTQLRTAQAQLQLPAQVNTAGLTIQKSLSSPLLLIALYSPHGTYDSIFLANYGYINLVDQLTRVSGIARVQVFGAGQYAMRCWVNPDRLASTGITVPQIISAIKRAEYSEPSGATRRRARAQRPAVYLYCAGARPPDLRRAVRKHYLALKSRRIHSPAQRRRPAPAGIADLQSDRPL